MQYDDTGGILKFRVENHDVSKGFITELEFNKQWLQIVEVLQLQVCPLPEWLRRVKPLRVRLECVRVVSEQSQTPQFTSPFRYLKGE